MEPWCSWNIVACFGDAYRRRHLEGFAEFLSTEPGAEYRGPLGLGPAEEICLHRRMFEPENQSPGQPPVPSELWPVGITLQLTPLRDWSERPDLYRSATNPQGLDPERWRATEAEWHYEIFFDTQTEVDYGASGSCKFIVLRDLSKSSGEERSVVIYRWEDRGSSSESTRVDASGPFRPAIAPPSSGLPAPVTWSDILALFRCA